MTRTIVALAIMLALPITLAATESAHAGPLFNPAARLDTSHFIDRRGDAWDTKPPAVMEDLFCDPFTTGDRESAWRCAGTAELWECVPTLTTTGAPDWECAETK